MQVIGRLARKGRCFIMKTIFETFPEARESGWTLVEVRRGTRQGTIYEEAGEITPIVSDGNSADLNSSPNQAVVEYDLLLYVDPAELPTVDIGVLVASYGIESPEGRFYDIAQAATGKNQAAGAIEHMELMLKLSSASEEARDVE